ncbi:phosphodiester glycosidase family protein [Streptomyces hoynatensis]|nr:phosphodiester glycosidase family protein [Streptomyces hoynatensis]
MIGRLRRAALAVAALTAVTIATPAAAAGEVPQGDGASFFGGSLPLSAAPETTRLAPGVTLTSLRLGERNADDHWTVHVYLPAEPDGPFGTANTGLGPRATADRVAGALRDAGFDPRVEQVTSPQWADRPAGTLGWIVRIGSWSDQAEATAMLNRVKAAGFTGQARWTAQDGTDPQAPQQVHVVRVDFRQFTGTVGTDYGPTVNGTEPLTELATAAGALAGINAQWFYNGAPAGLFVQDGKILGSATQGRGGIRITGGGRHVDVDTYTAHLTLRAGGATAEIDGVNRIPGVVPNCGGVGGDQPTERPQHDLTCTDSSELVEFTPEYGTVPGGAGAEVVLDRHGRVTAVHAERGARVPEGGTTVQAIGESADWLLAHARVGARLGIERRVEDGRGHRVPLTPDTTILQVGPTLVRDGRISVDAVADGLVHEGTDLTFTYNWAVRSNPRSMIGVDGRGRLLLVALDGRQAGYSEGLGVSEAAELMQLLGAREALNLDGGGSTVMTAAGLGIVNRPSDATGERSLGNVLLVRP